MINLSSFPQKIDDGFIEASNNAQDKLAKSMNWQSEQVFLENAKNFPDKNGIIRIDGEYIYYEFKKSNNLHGIIRGYSGTSPTSHRDGSVVIAPCIAEMHNMLRDAVENLQKKVGLPSDSSSGDSKATLRSRIAHIKKKWLKPKANFMAMLRKGHAPLGVQFVDFSLGDPIRWAWDFGDGSFSDDKNPYHEYRESGNYDVTLTIFSGEDENTASVKSKKMYVNVLSDEIDRVIFYAKSISHGVESPTLQGNPPFTIRFYDQTIGKVGKRIWNFGDGAIKIVEDPYQMTVEHTYQGDGVFLPSLTIMNEGEMAKRSLDIFVEIITK
jgi:PKD repeat protein